MGRHPDGADQFYRLQTKTPGSPNQRHSHQRRRHQRADDAPISGDADDQCVELYNRTAAAGGLERVALGGRHQFHFSGPDDPAGKWLSGDR